ncbi:restriction endonuclease [Xanthomonas arboricola]
MPWLLSHQSGPIAQGFNQGISAVLAPISWMVLGVCCLAAVASFVGSYQLRKLLDICTTLESLAAKGWRQFEMLVGEAFCRQSYAVEEASQDGACVGINLIPLKDDGRRILMQCKQWKHRQVHASVAREMYDLLGHHNSDAVKIFCVGIYKKRCQQVFVQGKPIVLVSGAQLLEMIRVVQPQAWVQVAPQMHVEPNF